MKGIRGGCGDEDFFYAYVKNDNEEESEAMKRIITAFYDRNIVIFFGDYYGFYGCDLSIVIFSEIPMKLFKRAEGDDKEYFSLKKQRL